MLQRLARVAGGHRNSPAAERRRSRRAATNSGIAPRGCRRARRRRICRQAGTRCAGGGASRQAIRDVAPEELAGAHGELGAWREDPAACRHKQRHSEAATGSGAAVTGEAAQGKGKFRAGRAARRTPHAERRGSRPSRDAERAAARSATADARARERRDADLSAEREGRAMRLAPRRRAAPRRASARRPTTQQHRTDRGRG